MELGKYSFGIGDRFSHQGEAQLRALMRANEKGVFVTPVWNKSAREHDIVHSEPESTRREADEAVQRLKWEKPYFVDADHINLSTVDRFMGYADFYTLDVAAFIGTKPDFSDTDQFAKSCEKLGGNADIPGLPEPVKVTDDLIRSVSGKYLVAIKEAGKIYRHICNAKGAGNFITEISMDEVSSPQTPVELFFILKMIADEGIPAQTIAPKFSGRFNKGVDYAGDPELFAREFEQDIQVMDYAVDAFGLPKDMKLSIHSGSDKFSLYSIISQLTRKYNKGFHLKTAGTTWLEEVTGLALAGKEGLAAAKDIYSRALIRKAELCKPYADVIDIDEDMLPTAGEVVGWTGEKFANTLRHIPGHPDYNPHFRQLIHVGYKVAAEMGAGYTGLLKRYSAETGQCVEENIYDRHLKRLFDLL